MPDLDTAGVHRALAQIDAATRRFIASVIALDSTALHGASALPDWTRGHVATHLARNAEALINLILHAADGTPRAMYPSVAARNAAIEAGADRSGPEVLADLTATGDRFLWAARELPVERWANEVTLLTGRMVPARWVLGGRMREVEFHHTDLDTGYTPDNWHPTFVGPCLDEISTALSGRPDMPALLLRATDSASTQSWTVLGTGPTVEVNGPAVQLLSWLTGRSKGAELVCTGPGATGGLPTLPAWA